MTPPTVAWLLGCDEPWTRYRTLLDLLGRPGDDADVRAARAGMLEHPRVQELIRQAASWPGRPLLRHNDAGHPIYALGTLADFGLRSDDPGVPQALNAVLAHQAAEGAFLSLLNVGAAYGGTGQDTWAWAPCDAPTLLYALLAFGLLQDVQVRSAVAHLVGQVEEGGWRCRPAPELGRFRGPGRKDHPCPIANVYALKALSLVPELVDSPATRRGAEMLLGHWERQDDDRYYLFGIGTDFRKLKYPFVWYDILHVAEVLSRFPFARRDPRFAAVLEAIRDQGGTEGQWTAGSMYQSWKGWSFADKKRPSPWLTLLVLRMEARVRAGEPNCGR